MTAILTVAFLDAARAEPGGRLTAVASPHTVTEAIPGGQWTMFMNGPRRIGRTPLVGSQTGALLWRRQAETNYGGPVIGRDGTIYQGTFAGRLLALRPDGTTKWSYQTGSIVESTPALLQDGRIAFVNNAGALYVLNPDGSLSWRYLTGTGDCCNSTSPAVGQDGTVYSGIDQRVYAFRPDGTIRWTYDIGFRVTGPVAVRPDGVVYVPASLLYALDADGSFLWKAEGFEFKVGGSPAVSSGGLIYVNDFESTVYAVNLQGTIEWRYQVADACCADVPSSPAIGPDGTIYAGETPSEYGVVLALNPDGSLKWQAQTDAFPTAMSVGGDGTIYFGATPIGPEDPAINALNPDGTLKWRYEDPGALYIRTTPAIGLGRRIYAGSFSALFALGP